MKQLYTNALFLTLIFSSAAVSHSNTVIQTDIWADNWFAFYIEDTLITEDSVSITTERSFNKESFAFKAHLPAELSFIIKDFKQNDSGLEYIGRRNQQMGDGGFIAQFKDQKTGKTLLVSDEKWRCIAIHRAPLNKECENSDNPLKACINDIKPEPNDWKASDFNTSQWPNAKEYSEWDVRPKRGYDKVDWDSDAKLIWTEDLETDNTLLCRVTLNPL